MHDILNKSSEQGQILLIVVLVMVVALTVGLSLVSQSVTNLHTSVDEENSKRAFSAAEAGIEQALKTGQGITSSISLGNNSNISQVNVQQIQGTQILLNNGNPVAKDDGTDVWLSTYPSYANQWGGTLKVYWGVSGIDCSDGALEIVVLTGSAIAPSISRYAYDPCKARQKINNFSNAPAAGVGNAFLGEPFDNAVTVSIPPAGGLVARIIPLYQSEVIGVTGTSALPPQGSIITSTGVSSTTERKISYFQGYQEVPSEFFYSIFAPK